ncbi:unnamed protein product, partial [Anisakis simplex]|uniref:NADPH:adrenodoxin oxidoreductase, mitochondrial (inferred by orthology to a C. elegans protein) n=1 Tax=Anisakis simplex TaxID=6269 RepID=A0A0M3KHB9_ANISI
MFELNSERLSLYCNVCLGRDVTYDELCKDYDAVVLAYGARRQKRLQIPNIQSKNVFSGGDFVSWYNAVPNMKAPNLDSNRAVIIGVGNVALDCCRILLSANSDRIIKSDMPTDILEHLSKSRINHVTIIGRRGPL